LLKPIVKVPKIIVALFALFEIVEIAKTIVVTIVVVAAAKAGMLLSGGIGFRLGFGWAVTRAYWRPVMRGW
jgi:hypothetical protein